MPKILAIAFAFIFSSLSYSISYAQNSMYGWYFDGLNEVSFFCLSDTDGFSLIRGFPHPVIVELKNSDTEIVRQDKRILGTQTYKKIDDNTILFIHEHNGKRIEKKFTRATNDITMSRNQAQEFARSKGLLPSRKPGTL